MTDRDSLVEKVRNLKAKAESTVNQNEMEAFAAGAAKLMAKYAIEDSELEIIKTEHDRVVMTIKYMNPWRRNLLNACCTASYSRLLLGKGEYVTICGRPHQIEAALDMFRFIEKQVIQIGRQLFPDRKSRVRAEAGLGLAVADKIFESHAKVKEEYQREDAAQGTSRELVLVGEEDAVDAFLDEQFPNRRQVAVKRSRRTVQSMIGAAAADRVQIRKEMQ